MRETMGGPVGGGSYAHAPERALKIFNPEEIEKMQEDRRKLEEEYAKKNTPTAPASTSASSSTSSPAAPEAPIAPPPPSMW